MPMPPNLRTLDPWDPQGRALAAPVCVCAPPRNMVHGTLWRDIIRNRAAKQGWETCYEPKFKNKMGQDKLPLVHNKVGRVSRVNAH